MIDEHALNIYTDGSCYHGPRRGGVGILYVWVDASGEEQAEPLEHHGIPQATGARMELLAATIALDNVAPYLGKRHFGRILIHSDSQYLVRSFWNAVNYWSRNGWRNREGRPIANADQWKALIKAAQQAGRKVEFTWVKRHAKDPFNKAADRLAKASAKATSGKPATVVTVRRKKSSKMTDPTSVEMLGQRVTIRIISSEWMPVQKTNRYRYEVMSRSSRFFRNVSILHSDLLMSPGHTYSVRLNTENGNPGVAKIFREVLHKLSADLEQSI